MNKPLAIIIPAYKATFLRETLESIANQSSKDFHLYIGDDCSPYDIKSIVDEFVDRIPLTYHRFESNMGGSDLVAQWERCIALSKYEPYIWLFSDDDTMDPECVKSFFNVNKSIKDNSLIHFNIRMLDDKKGGNIIKLPKFDNQISSEAFLKQKLSGKIVSYVVEFIFSRKVYESIGGFQNFDLAWGSDFMTWLKMSVISPNGIYTIQNENALVNWRSSAENISPNKSYGIIIRKLNSLIGNAAFVRSLMIKHPDCFPTSNNSLRWLRFPLGEIWRNRKIITSLDMIKLSCSYFKQVFLKNNYIR